MSGVRGSVGPMPSRRLSPRSALDVAMSAIITRNLRTDNPAPVIAELHRLAGDDRGLLAEVCGLVIGYYRDEQCAALCDLLEAEVDGVAPWIELGQQRRSRGVHGGPERRD